MLLLEFFLSFHMTVGQLGHILQGAWPAWQLASWVTGSGVWMDERMGINSGLELG